MAADTIRSEDGPLARNPLSIAGAWITTLSVFAFITYVALEAFELLASPYAGLFGFVVVPAVFAAGLLLIPIGIWNEARRRRRGRPAWQWPAVSLSSPRTRIVLAVILGLTLVNLAIVAVAAVGVAHYSESNRFCGQLCHTPMEPQFVAHQSSTHSRVDCVSCHVAPGASGAVTAKLNGTRQLYHLLFGSYSRPIRFARDRVPEPAVTCSGCHEASSAPGEVVQKAFVEHKDDEANTELRTTMNIDVGKNHWHARPDVVIEFVAADDTLETIPYVKATVQGITTEYRAEGVTGQPAGPLRRMDCLDCHSRPAHRLTDSPAQAVDRALLRGEVPSTLPFARRELIAALEAEYPDADAARQGIAAALTKAFGTGTPGSARAIEVAQRLYASNVFPNMNVTWGTYKTHINHLDDSGCFRCHDDSHKAGSDEQVIRQDCELCHVEQ
jgi:nitrate/TMAO reductase-like tetraheme cytochrome c subunit